MHTTEHPHDVSANALAKAGIVFLSLLVLVMLATIASASDYQCADAFGCTAQLSENGKLVTYNFRKGDIICTEDGWLVSTQNGWEKLKGPKPGGSVGSMVQGLVSRHFRYPSWRGHTVKQIRYRCVSATAHAASQQRTGKVETFYLGDQVDDAHYSVARTSGRWVRVGR